MDEITFFASTLIEVLRNQYSVVHKSVLCIHYYIASNGFNDDPNDS
jgi:hypothetical protein